MVKTIEEYFPSDDSDDARIDFLVKLLDLDSPRHKIHLKKMSGGITNAVYRLDTPGMRYIVRVFGNNTDRIIDRKLEEEHILKINFIDIFANFLNGTVVSYIEGRTIDLPMMSDKYISEKIAQAVGKFHNVTIHNDISSDSNEIFEHIEKFIDGLNPEFSKNGQYIDIGDLKKRLGLLKCELSEEMKDSPIALCHCDLLADNILWDGESSVINLCDYEYSCYTWPEFDIANHFFEYCGFGCELSRFPSIEHQCEFVYNYLSTIYNTFPNEKDVQKWVYKVNKLVKLSCFFWGCWGYFQAINSNVNFPYFEYAQTRIMLMDYQLPLPENHPMAQEPLVDLK